MKRLLLDEEGQTAMEYAFLASLLALVCVTILLVLGHKSRDTFTEVNDAVITNVR